LTGRSETNKGEKGKIFERSNSKDRIEVRRGRGRNCDRSVVG